MAELIDIGGLEALAGDLGAAPVDRLQGAVPTLEAIGRPTDAAVVATLVERIAATLSMASRDAGVRAAEMAATEAELQRVLAAVSPRSGSATPWPISEITDRQRHAWERLHQLLERRDVYRQIGGYASEVLVAETEARLAELVAGFGRRDWAAVAYLQAGVDPATLDPGAGLVANDARVRAIYEFYGDAFRATPEMQWAGFANLVGPTFYAGWQDIHVLKTVIDDSDRAEYLWNVAMLPELPAPVWSIVDLVDAIPVDGWDLAALATSTTLGWLEVKMLAMQREIFDDIGWQLAAYRYGGLEAVERGAAFLDDRRHLVDAWTDVASGEPARLAEANRYFLEREQRQIIQDDYDAIFHFAPPAGPVLIALMSLIAQSPVPGGRPYREVVTREVSIPVPIPDEPDVWPPWELIPLSMGKISVTVPRGNVANFDDRWEWIVTDLLPAYEVLLDDPDRLHELIETPIEVRAAEQRLLGFLPYPG